MNLGEYSMNTNDNEKGVHYLGERGFRNKCIYNTW